MNTETDCLLTPLLNYNPTVAELYETYFICIRNIRKDATYGTLPSTQNQITIFQDAIKDRLTFLYTAAVLQDNLEAFLSIWNKIINKEGNIRLPPATKII